MAETTISFAPITLDAPFQEARASNHTASTPTPRVSVLGLPSIVLASTPSMREAPTQPAIEGDSLTSGDPEPGSGVFARDPEWCIDLADGMNALHAVELFARLATGEIPAETRVWRVGREAWTPARDVPELRCAVEDAIAEELDALLDEPSIVIGPDAAFDEVFEDASFDGSFGDDEALSTYDGERPSLEQALMFAQTG